MTDAVAVEKRHLSNDGGCGGARKVSSGRFTCHKPKRMAQMEGAAGDVSSPVCAPVNPNRGLRFDSERRLHYAGADGFRLRVVLATLFARKLQLSDIRAESTKPGLARYEASLLRLLDKITDGGTFHIDVSGTELCYDPGMIVGCDGAVHSCGVERNMTYFLEALVWLAPFAKTPLSIRLRGVTHGPGVSGILDASVDQFRLSALPLIRRMLFPNATEGPTLRVIKRGLAPLGQGEVEFFCPILKSVSPFQLVELGRVKRVRGLAFTNQVSPQFSTRVIDNVRGVLNDYLPDVWVYAAGSRPGLDGPSPGYGVTLVAETMKGHFKSCESVVTADYNSVALAGGAERMATVASEPADERQALGRLVAERLLLEIHFGGVTDLTFQHLPLVFMALAEDHQTSKVLLSRLTPMSVQVVRHLKDFCGVMFSFTEIVTEPQDKGFQTENDEDSPVSTDDGVDEEESNSKLDRKDLLQRAKTGQLQHVPQTLVVCVGLGYKNVGKKTF